MAKLFCMYGENFGHLGEKHCHVMTSFCFDVWSLRKIRHYGENNYLFGRHHFVAFCSFSLHYLYLLPSIVSNCTLSYGTATVWANEIARLFQFLWKNLESLWRINLSHGRKVVIWRKKVPFWRNKWPGYCHWTANEGRVLHPSAWSPSSPHTPEPSTSWGLSRQEERPPVPVAKVEGRRSSAGGRKYGTC